MVTSAAQGGFLEETDIFTGSDTREKERERNDVSKEARAIRVVTSGSYSEEMET